MKIKSVKIQIAEEQIEAHQAETRHIPVGDLVEAAVKASAQAYAIYSGFKVGAAVLLESGIITTGNNQENAAYPSGLCAERVAIFHANATYPDQKVIAVAISAQYHDEPTPTAVPPCGSCRQVLLETERRFNHPIVIYMHGANEVIQIESAAQLLPLAFDGSFLNTPP